MIPVNRRSLLLAGAALAAPHLAGTVAAADAPVTKDQALTRLCDAAERAGATFHDADRRPGELGFTLPGRVGVVVAELDDGRTYLSVIGRDLDDGVLARIFDVLTGVVAGT